MKKFIALLALGLSIGCAAQTPTYQTELNSLKVIETITAADFLFTDGTPVSAASTIPGPAGEQGIQGIQGLTGAGVPSGGLAGKILAKASNADYDFVWVDQSAGGVPGDNPSYSRAYIVNVAVSRNLNGSDIYNTLECTANSTITIPVDFTVMEIGDTMNLEAHNGAELIIQAAAGVTVNYVSAGSGSLSSRNDSVLFGLLRKNGTNSYIISGQ